jgi:hypothetical protein
MIAASAKLNDLVLDIRQEIRVHAPLDVTFAALLEQLGPFNETADDRKMPMKIEAWPGGRWYRDLGDGNGHFWGNVQAIKRPTLLEISGPLFMSSPATNNLQYRLSEEKGVTLITFRHSAFGVILEEYREGVKKGWSHMHEQVRKRAESSR